MTSVALKLLQNGRIQKEVIPFYKFRGTINGGFFQANFRKEMSNVEGTQQGVFFIFHYLLECRELNFHGFGLLEGHCAFLGRSGFKMRKCKIVIFDWERYESSTIPESF
ncbi:MAG: hypothetical protein QXH03_09345 [Candidatus Bathyarchaeia archaeon]